MKEILKLLAEETLFLRITVFFFIYGNDKNAKFRVLCRDIWNIIYEMKVEFLHYFRHEHDFMLPIQYYGKRSEFVLFRPFLKYYYLLMS